MTMIQVIDELMVELDVPQDQIDRMRVEAIGYYVKTPEDRQRIERELNEEEVQSLKNLGRLFILALMSIPGLQEDLVKRITKEIRNN